MKLSSLTKVILFSVSGAAVLLASSAQAGPRATRKARKARVPVPVEEERYVVVTGSRIPQKVKVRSIGTTTPSNVRVYSRHDLDRSGRATTAEALSTIDPSISH